VTEHAIDKALETITPVADPSLADAVHAFVAAQPVEPRDTVEATPLTMIAAGATQTAPPVSAASPTPIVEPTESVIVTLDESPTSDDTVPANATEATDQTDHTADESEQAGSVDERVHQPDKIAEERGLAPLRFPKLSQAFIPLRRMGSRKLVVGSLAFAGVCTAVSVGAVLWARSAVAEAEQRSPSTASPAITNMEAAERDQLGVAMPVTETAPAPIGGTCTATVTASSAEAKIFVDGKAHGSGPQTITGTCGAMVVVEARHPRYADFKREVVLENEMKIEVRLERERTTLTLITEPPGAQVTYDGRVLGTTPLTTDVNRHELGHMYFRLDGYESDWRKIVPKDRKRTVSVKLEKIR
jgi:hypothetical protein